MVENYRIDQLENEIEMSPGGPGEASEMRARED